MISPISKAHADHAEQASKPQVPKPESQAQPSKSGALSHDQVTLKSGGEVDQDGGK
jgi:hypothetical protein